MSTLSLNCNTLQVGQVGQVGQPNNYDSQLFYNFFTTNRALAYQAVARKKPLSCELAQLASARAGNVGRAHPSYKS
jgi:hypothetical protein